VREPRWIEQDLVLQIHERQIDRFGGSQGIRDEILLGSALARPLNLFSYGEPSLFDLAAAYGYGITKNHPFVDGNKRTAFAVMVLFLLINGYSLEVSEDDAVSKMENLAMDLENQDSIAEWLRENSIGI
jgi:death on curing protein